VVLEELDRGRERFITMRRHSFFLYPTSRSLHSLSQGGTFCTHAHDQQRLYHLTWNSDAHAEKKKNNHPIDALTVHNMLPNQPIHIYSFNTSAFSLISHVHADFLLLLFGGYVIGAAATDFLFYIIQ